MHHKLRLLFIYTLIPTTKLSPRSPNKHCRPQQLSHPPFATKFSYGGTTATNRVSKAQTNYAAGGAYTVAYLPPTIHQKRPIKTFKTLPAFSCGFPVISNHIALVQDPRFAPREPHGGRTHTHPRGDADDRNPIWVS